MNLLFFQMQQRKEYLESLSADIAKKLKYSPQGKLRVSNNKGIPRYYHILNSKDTCGNYIPIGKQELACQLAQKDYMQRLYQKVEDELKDIEEYLSRYGENYLENVYSDMNEYRRNIVIPMAIPDIMFIKQWEREHYTTNPYYPEERVYSTKKDELVRSKSEVLLADMYYELGIPYRYEALLLLRNGKVRYPDFTLLKTRTREIVYHEHFGLMDDEEYRHSCFVKLDEYRKNGIYMGKNLIITYEAEGCYLNIKEIRSMMQEIFDL